MTAFIPFAASAFRFCGIASKIAFTCSATDMTLNPPFLTLPSVILLHRVFSAHFVLTVDPSRIVTARLLRHFRFFVNAGGRLC
jgi:hypothetical protein